MAKWRIETSAPDGKIEYHNFWKKNDQNIRVINRFTDGVFFVGTEDDTMPILATGTIFDVTAVNVKMCGYTLLSSTGTNGESYSPTCEIIWSDNISPQDRNKFQFDIEGDGPGLVDDGWEHLGNSTEIWAFGELTITKES